MAASDDLNVLYRYDIKNVPIFCEIYHFHILDVKVLLA